MKQLSLTQHIAWWLIAIAFCVATVAAFAGVKYQQIQHAIQDQAKQPEYYENVHTHLAQTNNRAETLTALGTIKRPKKITLRNELPGFITKVKYLSGSPVKKGEVILQLDVSEEEARLKADLARVKLARAVHARNVKLSTSNAVSAETLERSQSELKVLQAQVEALRTVIRKKTIIAPFNGVLGIHQLQEGQYIEPSSALTDLVARGNRYWVEFEIPQLFAPLAVGHEVLVRHLGTNSNTSQTALKAKIIAANPLINQQTRSRRYRALLIAHQNDFAHNLSVQVEIPSLDSQALISIPNQAVQTRQSGQFLYVLDEIAGREHFYRARPVAIELKAKANGMALVLPLEELYAGQRVAAKGAFKLYEGVLVHANTPVEESRSEGS